MELIPIVTKTDEHDCEGNAIGSDGDPNLFDYSSPFYGCCVICPVKGTIVWLTAQKDQAWSQILPKKKPTLTSISIFNYDCVLFI